MAVMLCNSIDTDSRFIASGRSLSREEGGSRCDLKLAEEAQAVRTVRSKPSQPAGNESCVALGRPVLRSVDSE